MAMKCFNDNLGDLGHKKIEAIYQWKPIRLGLILQGFILNSLWPI